jgi:hypothetical protein
LYCLGQEYVCCSLSAPANYVLNLSNVRRSFVLISKLSLRFVLNTIYLSLSLLKSFKCRNLFLRAAVLSAATKKSVTGVEIAKDVSKCLLILLYSSTLRQLAIRPNISIIYAIIRAIVSLAALGRLFYLSKPFPPITNKRLTTALIVSLIATSFYLSSLSICVILRKISLSNTFA